MLHVRAQKFSEEVTKRKKALKWCKRIKLKTAIQSYKKRKKLPGSLLFQRNVSYDFSELECKYQFPHRLFKKKN
jgi:hypothetical protein